MQNTMLENGLDFILDAVRQLKLYKETEDEEEKSRALKYCLLHLWPGIELVMKARIYLENWAYIFSDIDKANKQNLHNGEFITIDYAKCIVRLKNLCNISLSPDDQKAFKELKDIRNQTEHFTSKASEEAIESRINHALTATVNFLKNSYIEFSSPSIVDIREDSLGGLTSKEEKYIEEINIAVGELDDQHLGAVELARTRACEVTCEDELVECPMCKEHTLVIGDGRCHCFLCGHEGDGESVAEEYLSSVKGLDEYHNAKDGEEYPLFQCPECGKYSFVKNERKYICFSCRAMYPLNEVGFRNDCGAPYIKYDADDDIGLCQGCLDNRVSD